MCLPKPWANTQVRPYSIFLITIIPLIAGLNTTTYCEKQENYVCGIRERIPWIYFPRTQTA